jgi:octaprenyl-diphosphate synthase
MTFQQVLEKYRSELELIEKKLEEYLFVNIPLIDMVARHIIRSGGKRLRPLLVVLSSRLCGYEGERCVPMAAIMEFIHTATLLHDDVVDHAEMRRGAASVNSTWGNETSVLVGDYLVASSFVIMARDADLQIIQLLSDTMTAMARGEAIQLSETGNIHITEEQYIRRITLKTAILIAAACQVGAILGNTDEDRRGSLANFGLNLGVAFQMLDDTLDYVARVDQFGKAIGKDLEERNITLPLIHTLKSAGEAHRREIIRIIDAEEKTDEDKLLISRYIQQYGGIAYTRKQAAQSVATAKSYLASFPACAARRALEVTADYVLERDS